MRNLVKSILSFSGAMPLFGLKQLTDLILDQDRAAENLDAVTQAAQRQLGAPLGTAFQNADRAQRQTVDLIADLLSPERRPGGPAPSAGPSASQAAPSADPAAPPAGPPQAFDEDFTLLQQILSSGPAGNPALILLLLSLYQNANQIGAGVAFFDNILVRFDSQLPPPLKAVYLGALGQLRAAYTAQVPASQQASWMGETLRILDEANALSGYDSFIVRWMIALVYAQLPAQLGLQERAFQELRWCVDNSAGAPDPGWMRPIYFSLAQFYRQANPARAEEYLRASGYASFDTEIVQTTLMSITPQGALFSPVQLQEIPIQQGKIFVLSGFQFSETFFVLSEDGRELIAIDAGAQPESEKAAYEFLKSRYPDLPRLTTVFMTHAHPDHLSGYSFLQQLNPRAKFYIRKTFAQDFDLTVEFPIPFDWILGESYRTQEMVGFKPDVEVSQEIEVRVGGTRFVVIPAPSGETSPPRQFEDAEHPGDALFIYLPDHGVMFVGDVAMIWFGLPFYAAQGSVSAFLGATEKIVEIQARTPNRPISLLHGHYPLTELFSSPAILQNVAKHVSWLRQEVVTRVFSGMDRAAIHHLNLVSPGLLQDPVAQIPYLALRRNLIDRLFDQRVGYWEPDMTGMDSLSQAEVGSIFSHYLGLSADDLADAIERMVASGDHELAARTVGWVLPRFPDSQRLAGLQKQVFAKLKEKYQQIDAFRFFVYSQAGDNVTLPVAAPSANSQG